MKTLKSILFLFLFITTSLFSQNSDQYVYQENFDNKGTWPTGSNDNRSLSVFNGRYYFEHKRSKESWKVSTSTFNLDTSKDFDMDISIQKISGVDNYGISFLYDYKDSNNYKEFAYTANGYFRVAKNESSTYTNIKEWTKSDKIKKGNYSVNQLTVSKRGSTVTFYINNSNVYSTSFKRFVGKQMALNLYRNQKVSIDFIKVKQINNNTNNNTFTSNKTILFEGFNNNNNNWPTKEDGDVSLEIRNGDYIFDHKRASGGWSSTLVNKINTSRNFKISAQIKKLAGIQNNGFGLIFGREDSKNQNMFFISGNGSYVIKHIKDGTQSFTKDWTESSHIKTGDGAVNYLKVEKDGSKLKYYINSNLVYTSYSYEFYGDRTGFIVYGKQKISIGYLSMAYTDSKSNNNNNNSNNKDKTTKTILYDSFYSNKNGWAIADEDLTKLEIKNSKYYFQYTGNKGWTTTKGFDFDATRDFKVEASIQKISGIKNNGFGIVFGRQDGDNQHQFLINALGSYSIDKYENGKLNTLVEWTKSSAIKKENYSTNLLKMEKRGSKFYYYINNSLVYTGSYMKVYGKRYGFSIFDPQKIAVDHIYISYLDNGPNNNNIFNNNTKFKGDLVFSDDFNVGNTNEWATQNDEKIHFRFKNGKYHVQHKRKDKGWSTYISKKFDSSKDFEIETKIDKISGVTNNSYGLTWGLDDNNGFRFFIASTGYYKISRTVNNKEEIIVKWTKSSNINQNNGASNILKVRRDGEYYKYYINNRYITKTDFEPFYGDKIGYVVYSDQEIAVDYLKIYKVKSNNNTNIVTNKKLTLPVYDNFDGNKNGWNLEDSDDYSVAIANSKLLLHKKKEGGIFISRDVTINTEKDFIIETALSRVTKSTDGLYGITFGRKNSSNEYSFLFSGNGSYIYRKFDNDVYKKIIPFTESSAIKTGIGESNKVKIVKSGNLLRFYINDQYVNETPFEGFFGSKFGYSIYYDKKIAVEYLDIKYQSSNFNNPPVVVITSPNVEAKRGFKIVKTKRIQVKGKATDSDGIYEITVNGIEANVAEDGTFIANVPLKYGKNDLIVKATDLKQASSTKTFVIKRNSPIIDNTIITDNKIDKLDIGFGKYHALIIGVSEYKDESIVDLNGEPTKDADALASLLISKYNFSQQNVTVLKNPTENQIIKQFYTLRKNVGKNDNLVIFYAGHGNYDEASEKGYWMPADAEMEFEGNVILNTSIVSYIKSINSKHTLLIADACFSGSILSTNRNYSKASNAVKTKYSLPSRRAITSGTLTTVPNKSVFMKYLLKRLRENTKTYLSAGQLFNMIEDPVINNTSGDNKPQYAPISRTGDEGGDFIFIKNN
ncbi:caspase family protein [uncultured Polaribacter sp.]|uniref:caspase family protein n=1 Tax=uncultured Polaribacter sp. TaxID=174711 RepID=UPI0026312D5C|nr:caspase family protein [uncultured Polaribacter sp.]